MYWNSPSLFSALSPRSSTWLSLLWQCSTSRLSSFWCHKTGNSSRMLCYLKEGLRQSDKVCKNLNQSLYSHSIHWSLRWLLQGNSVSLKLLKRDFKKMYLQSSHLICLKWLSGKEVLRGFLLEVLMCMDSDTAPCVLSVLSQGVWGND